MIDKTLEFLLNESNLRHSQHGDPLNHYLESISLKLQFSMTDRTVLGTITDAELEVLTMEVNNVKENKNESF